MSISLSPTHKQLPVLPPTNLPLGGNPVILGNGATAFVGKDSVDVVTVSPSASNFKTPLPKQQVHRLKDRLKSSAAKAKSPGASNAGGCQYYPPRSHNDNNNIPSNNQVNVRTTYIQLSDSVETSSSGEQLFTPAAKRMLANNRKPSKPIKKVGAKGKGIIKLLCLMTILFFYEFRYSIRQEGPSKTKEGSLFAKPGEPSPSFDIDGHIQSPS